MDGRAVRCPKDIPILLRGKANACLAGGPKTEEFPGGQFCSYLESVGKCKLEGSEDEERKGKKPIFFHWKHERGKCDVCGKELGFALIQGLVIENYSMRNMTK